MKVAKGCIKTAFQVRDKRDGRTYDCFLQDYEYYPSKKHETRFNIGFNGWTEWHFFHYESEEGFNKHYEIV